MAMISSMNAEVVATMVLGRPPPTSWSVPVPDPAGTR